MGWKAAVTKTMAPLLLAAGINACSDNGENILYQKAATDSSGRVIFNDRPFVVKDDATLEGITVHYLESNEHYLALAVDETGRHFPASKGDSVDKIERNLNQKPLIQEIIIIMGLAYQSYKLYQSTQSPDRILLEETENMNRYCISLEQMKNDYIDLPAGILSLAPQAAGDDAEDIKIAATTPLKMLFEDYIIHKYGEHEGYEVWAPKISTSFCGNDYKELVCPIDTQKLSQKLWDKSNAPIWKINGPCRLDDTGEEDAATETPDKFYLIKNSDGTVSDLLNGLQWFNNAQNLPYGDAVSYCREDFGSSGWRLPTVKELEIYILHELINDCYAPALFNGCDEIWYWSSESSGSLTQAVSYKFGRRQGKDNNPSHTNGAKCVRELL